jgi:hypothetical protein
MGARSASPEPTSNVCHVPKPITGICAPVEGIARVSSGVARGASPDTAAITFRPPAKSVAEPSNRNAARRFIRDFDEEGNIPRRLSRSRKLSIRQNRLKKSPSPARRRSALARDPQTRGPATRRARVQPLRSPHGPVMASV